MNTPIADTTVGHSIGFDLQPAIKNKLNAIQLVSLEPTTNPNPIYPVAISTTDNGVSVFRIQAQDTNYIKVLLNQALNSSVGRSIGIDLSDSVKTLLGSVATTSQVAQLGSNNTLTGLNTFQGLTTFQRKVSVNSDINITGVIQNQDLADKFGNLSLTQYFKYLASSITEQYYKLGTLTLPQGENQAVIQVNLCYGYNFNPGNYTNVPQ